VLPRLSMVLFFWVGVVTSTAALSESGPIFRFVGKAGPHAVGLKVVEQYDTSRTYRYSTDELGKPYVGERARPLQTLIWYPAEHVNSPAMTVRDYANLWTTETTFGKSRTPARAKEWIAAMAPALESSLWAVRDAPEAKGRYPVVIYAPSFSAMAWENADLCEYLATHGYVVIATPNMGAMSRKMSRDIAGINEQARDISFLIGYAQTLPNTDMTAVAAAGFSWGGMANLFAAARDTRIHALVALDGSQRYFPGLVKEAGDVHPEEMTIPMLYFAQGSWTVEDETVYLNDAERNGPSVLNAWTHGDLITVRMLGLTHREHSSMYQRNEDVWREFSEEQQGDYDRKDGIFGYSWLARYTHAFLDAYLKHDTTELAFLKRKPAENDVPQHLMAVRFRAATGVAPSFERFRTEIGRQGFNRASEIYAEMRKEKASFKLDEEAINFWSEELMNGDHDAEAIALLKLNTQINPDSSASYVMLGEAYRKTGQRRLSIDSYRIALEKNPINEDVKRKLEALEAASLSKPMERSLPPSASNRSSYSNP